MNVVGPIRSRTLIKRILYFLKNNFHRDFILFFIGIHTGLRISDILRLKVSDVKGKSHIEIIEKKTRKKKKFYINKELRKEIREYCKGKENYSFLFCSRKGINSPITRVRAYQILKDIGDQFDIHISCHTLRKTFGYFHYSDNKDIATLMEIFNHSSQKVTLIYIGVMQEEIDKTIKDLSFL